ncbi:MAG: hypothetical protein HY901_20675 [Deltaproteobacteria bacterium]|nr:hypothetical protein [Deltaproteobacteria bacterium]
MTLGAIEEAIAGRYGLQPRPSAGATLARASEELAQRLALPLPALLERAERDPELLRHLAGALTVDESYFLRQPEQFELVLARIGREPAAVIGRPVTIWSAGCSHGEEPYTVAILVAERLPWARPFVRIVANDLSREAISLARQGRFGDWSMRGVPEWFRSRYFQRRDRAWHLDPLVRSAVKFEHLAILEHAATLADRSVDVVLFRNVAIYLEKPALERVYGAFARVLANDGLLVLGASDPPPSRELFALRGEPAGSSYVRRSATLGSSPRAPATTASPAPDFGAAMAPRGAAPPSPRQEKPDVQARYRRAVELGNQNGSSPLALEEASFVVEAAPEWSAGYALRATLLLAASRHREAVADLRRAVYLAPEDLPVRFLYATALRAAGLGEQARAEAQELLARLEKGPSGRVLEDGRTTAAELVGAARELLEEGR